MSIDFSVNPMTEEFRTNSVSYYLKLLQHQPVVKTELNQWLFCNYSDVQRILSDHECFQRPVNWSVDRKPECPLKDFGKNNIVGMNPPKHTRFRQSAARGFTRAHVQAMAPKIEKLVDKPLDDMAQKNSGDFITDFSFPPSGLCHL